MRQTGTDKIAAFAFQAGVADLLEGIPHGAAIVDQEFRMVAMNGLLEAMTGHDSADARGVDADSIIRSNLGAAGRNWRKLIAGDATSSVEGDVLTAQRKRLPARLTLKPIKDGFGVAAGVFVLVEDISLIKEIESKGLSGQVSHGFIGTSPKMLEIFETLPVLASTNATLLVTGETGTGKDLLAESVHKASRRSNYPFIKVNCGALPESLLESELFGHVKGAFTGAHADKPGMFRLAQGGTIYLTEIGDLPLPLQVKLLTVLDDREFFPVGGSKKLSVDVRLIAGTHHDLKRLVGEGRFREDLYFRLNVLRAHMPPLRQRAGDVPILLGHFLGIFAGSMQKSLKGFTKKALDRLQSYAYPGNVRELSNIVEYAVAVCKGDSITPEDLPEYISSGSGPGQAEAGGAAPSVTYEGGWSSIEKRRILDALISSGGNRGKAASALGWGRSTLWRKIRHYGIG